MPKTKQQKYLSKINRVASRAYTKFFMGKYDKKPHKVKVGKKFIDVIVSDTVCKILTGDNNIPNGAYNYNTNTIYINNALLKMKEDIIVAVIRHELGHRKYRHNGSYNLKAELAADNHCIRHGNAKGQIKFINNFITYLKNNDVPVPEDFKVRLKNLKKSLSPRRVV